MKNKYAKELREALENVFIEGGRSPQIIHTNKGSEFLNCMVMNLMKKYNVKLITTESDRKASVVERLNKTLKGFMFKYFTYKNTRKYIGVLQDLVSRYNK